MTLMKESGSLSQKHARTGSNKEKKSIKYSEVWGKVHTGLGRRVQCKLNVSGVFTVGEDCLESCVVQYGSH